jgi:hypothetical protein
MPGKFRALHLGLFEFRALHLGLFERKDVSDFL